jgi:imidazoleglycerol phosphate synthase glutamine amidotransferase subunit HisH
MKMLLASGLDTLIHCAACIGNLLGMQLMCNKTEGKHKRIEIFDVDVIKFTKVKVPQMG